MQQTKTKLEELLDNQDSTLGDDEDVDHYDSDENANYGDYDDIVPAKADEDELSDDLVAANPDEEKLAVNRQIPKAVAKESETKLNRNDDQDNDFLATARESTVQNNLSLATFKLDCEVASINLSLKQLIELEKGASLDLAPLPPTVNLKLNGKLLARGILVDINGRLGVKIIEKI